MFRKLIIGVAVVLALTFGFAASTSCDVIDLGHNKIYLYDHVDSGDSVKWMKAMSEDSHYTVYIQSPGGSALEFLAFVYRMLELQEDGYEIETVCMGYCLSAAGFTWIMGDERVAHASDKFMFHEVVLMDKNGDLIPREKWNDEMKEYANEMNTLIRKLLLHKLRDTELVNILMNPKGNTKYASNENWFTGEELDEMGLVTKLIK